MFPLDRKRCILHHSPKTHLKIIMKKSTRGNLLMEPNTPFLVKMKHLDSIELWFFPAVGGKTTILKRIKISPRPSEKIGDDSFYKLTDDDVQYMILPKII